MLDVLWKLSTGFYSQGFVLELERVCSTCLNPFCQLFSLSLCKGNSFQWVVDCFGYIMVPDNINCFYSRFCLILLLKMIRLGAAAPCAIVLYNLVCTVRNTQTFLQLFIGMRNWIIVCQIVIMILEPEHKSELMSVLSLPLHKFEH